MICMEIWGGHPPENFWNLCPLRLILKQSEMYLTCSYTIYYFSLTLLWERQDGKKLSTGGGGNTVQYYMDSYTEWYVQVWILPTDMELLRKTLGQSHVHYRQLSACLTVICMHCIYWGSPVNRHFQHISDKLMSTPKYHIPSLVTSLLRFLSHVRP